MKRFIEKTNLIERTNLHTVRFSSYLGDLLERRAFKLTWCSSSCSWCLLLLLLLLLLSVPTVNKDNNNDNNNNVYYVKGRIV